MQKSNSHISRKHYSPVRNCQRPTLIQTGPPLGGATLKNSAALISSAPCRGVADGLKNERFTLFFFTNASPTLIASRPRIVGATLENFTTLIQVTRRRDVADAYLQRRR